MTERTHEPFYPLALARLVLKTLDRRYERLTYTESEDGCCPFHSWRRGAHGKPIREVVGYCDVRAAVWKFLEEHRPGIPPRKADVDEVFDALVAVLVIHQEYQERLRTAKLRVVQ